MIPISSLRPVLPLFDFTAPRWGSSIRLRPRHVFHVQRFLSHGKKRERERESLPRRWRFPRKSMPFWSKIWWTTRRIPMLPIRLILLIGECLYRNWQSWNLPMVIKGVKINSRVGYFFFGLGFGCVRILSMMVQPWGILSVGLGPSNEPTMPAPPAPIYASYAYIDKRDVKRGDVVSVMNPDGKGFMCKRIAALEGDWIRVTRYGPLMTIRNKIVHVPFGHCFLLGDNPPRSYDSRTFGPVPIESVLAKVQWRCGLDGISWIDHHQYPWLQNKAIEHLHPAGGGLTTGGNVTTQPKKSLTTMPRANGKPLPSSSPLEEAAKGEEATKASEE